MAILAIPSDKLFVINEEKTKEFIEKSNERKITAQHLTECKKTSSLFKKNY